MTQPTPTLRLLPEPFRVLDSDEAREWTFRVGSYQLGTIYHRPQGEAIPLELLALRLYLVRENERDEPAYWDVTSRQLRATLLPLLDQLVSSGRRLRIRAVGVRPRTSFTVDVLP